MNNFALLSLPAFEKQNEKIKVHAYHYMEEIKALGRLTMLGRHKFNIILTLKNNFHLLAPVPSGKDRKVLMVREEDDIR